MADLTCYDCGQPADQGYRRIGHRMQVLVLCQACTGRIAADMTQQMTRWLEHDRALRLTSRHSPACVSPEEAGIRLGISRRSVYRMIDSGLLEAIEVRTRPDARRGTLSIPLAAVEDYIRERRGGAA